MRIGLLTAMPEEASAYFPAAKYAFDQVRKIDGVAVRISGVGKVNAALATAELIRAGSDVIFVGGVCASLTGAAPGTSYLLRSAFQYDYGILKDEGIEYILPGQIPGEEAASHRDFFADRRSSIIAQKFIENMGRIATGDTFVESTKRAKELAENCKANILDMETAAVAQTCNLYDVPWCGVKTVTDQAAEGSSKDFWANLTKATKVNSAIGLRVIRRLEEYF